MAIKIRCRLLYLLDISKWLNSVGNILLLILDKECIMQSCYHFILNLYVFYHAHSDSIKLARVYHTVKQYIKTRCKTLCFLRLSCRIRNSNIALSLIIYGNRPTGYVCVCVCKQINILAKQNKTVTMIQIRLKEFREWYLIEEYFQSIATLCHCKGVITRPNQASQTFAEIWVCETKPFSTVFVIGKEGGALVQ